MNDSHSGVPNVKIIPPLVYLHRDWYCYQHLDTDQNRSELASMDAGRNPYRLRCCSHWLCYFEIQRCKYDGSA